jgi:hypothetical protein
METSDISLIALLLDPFLTFGEAVASLPPHICNVFGESRLERRRNDLASSQAGLDRSKSDRHLNLRRHAKYHSASHGWPQ